MESGSGLLVPLAPLTDAEQGTPTPQAARSSTTALTAESLTKLKKEVLVLGNAMSPPTT
jgi:hypothetical protein